jgi:hypothetical protein
MGVMSQHHIEAASGMSLGKSPHGSLFSQDEGYLQKQRDNEKKM